MRLLEFTHPHPILDVQITPLEWKPEPKVTIAHNDWYARAWECENEKWIFDDDHDNSPIPNSLDTVVRFELAADETSVITTTIPESIPKIFPEADRLCDETDTDYYMELDSDTNVKRPSLSLPTPAAQGMIYVIIWNWSSMTTADIKILLRPLIIYGAHTYTFRKS